MRKNYEVYAMAAIEISFDVYKALTMRRTSESVTYDDVLRELLRLPQSSEPKVATIKARPEGWSYKDVFFPNGTEFRANYKGKPYTASVENGALMLNGERIGSPSLAAHKITKTSVNGWRFWECRLPGDSRWRMIEALRPGR